MAPFGKIYSYPENLRVHRALIVADMNGLEIEVPSSFTVRVDNRTPEYLAKFPLGKVPAFEGADGFTLTESVAIAEYLARSGPKAGQLLGTGMLFLLSGVVHHGADFTRRTDPKSQSAITQWALFTEAEFFSNAFIPIAMGVLKVYTLDEKRFNDCITGLERDLKYLEVVLKGGKKHLVGNQVTLADLMVSSILFSGFKHVIDAEMRKDLPNVVAYAKNFFDVPAHKKHFGELAFCTKRVSL
ncbi:glutathione S-transferase [Xylaria palmicola]|nr:glutathione S-transferase [Xylaria palmicola]